MDWIPVLILFGVVAAVVILKQLGQLSKTTAVEYLKEGARVLDVRTVTEYQSGHLPNAINIPLGEITQQVCQQMPDKAQVLLLHCHSGTRSAIAARMLKRMGYTRVFNLGSYSRAEKIARDRSR
jgi:phage shock protein E